MQVVLAAIMIMLLAIPAQAQQMGRHKQNVRVDQSSEQQKKTKADQEKAYKSSLDKIPNRPPADPWANMR
jgi:hypothetical protein